MLVLLLDKNIKKKLFTKDAYTPKRVTQTPGYIDFVFNFSSVLMAGGIYGSCEAVMLTRAQIDLYTSVKS